MVAMVQHRYGSITNTSAGSLAYSANVASGNLLVVADGWNSSVVVVSAVDDDHSLTYSSLTAQRHASNISLQAFGATAISATAPTVTWHMNATAAHHMLVTEISGHNTTTLLDGVTSTRETASAQTTLPAGALNTNHASNLILGIFRTQGNTVFSSNTSYDILGTPTARLGAVTRIVGATDAYNPSIICTTAGTTASWCALHLQIAAADAAFSTHEIASLCTGSGTLTANMVMHIPFSAQLTGEG